MSPETANDAVQPEVSQRTFLSSVARTVFVRAATDSICDASSLDLVSDFVACKLGPGTIMTVFLVGRLTGSFDS